MTAGGPILGSEGDILIHLEPELGLVTDQAAESLQMQILGIYSAGSVDLEWAQGPITYHFKRSADGSDTQSGLGLLGLTESETLNLGCTQESPGLKYQIPGTEWTYLTW